MSDRYEIPEELLQRLRRYAMSEYDRYQDRGIVVQCALDDYYEVEFLMREQGWKSGLERLRDV